MSSPDKTSDSSDEVSTSVGYASSDPTLLSLVSLPIGLPSTRAQTLTPLVKTLRNAIVEGASPSGTWSRTSEALANPENLVQDVGLTTQIVHLQQVLSDCTGRWRDRPSPSAPMWNAVVLMVKRYLASANAPAVIASGSLSGVLDAYLTAAFDLARDVEILVVTEAYSSAVVRLTSTFRMSPREAALAWLRHCLEIERTSRGHPRSFTPPLNIVGQTPDILLPNLNGWPDRVERRFQALAANPDDMDAERELDAVSAELTTLEDLLSESLQAEAAAVRGVEDRGRAQMQSIAQLSYHQGARGRNSAAASHEHRPEAQTSASETFDAAALAQAREMLGHLAHRLGSERNIEAIATDAHATDDRAEEGETALPSKTDLMRPVLVLGMHRSGTSCLTGCLEEAGLHLGVANTQAPFNAKGNRENIDFMHLHDRLLARYGAQWDVPRDTAERRWPSVETAVRDVAIAKLRASRPDAMWGIKDPRTLLVLKGWEDLSPRYVGTFRHPVAVRRSLQHRATKWKAPMPDEKADQLWIVYNRALLDVYEREPFPVVRFDQPIEAYRQDLRAIGDHLGLPGLERVDFRSGDLETQSGEGVEISREVHELWERLLALPRPCAAFPATTSQSPASPLIDSAKIEGQRRAS